MKIISRRYTRMNADQKETQTSMACLTLFIRVHPRLESMLQKVKHSVLLLQEVHAVLEDEVLG